MHFRKTKEEIWLKKRDISIRSNLRTPIRKKNISAGKQTEMPISYALSDAARKKWNTYSLKKQEELLKKSYRKDTAFFFSVTEPKEGKDVFRKTLFREDIVRIKGSADLKKKRKEAAKKTWLQQKRRKVRKRESTAFTGFKSQAQTSVGTTKKKRYEKKKPPAFVSSVRLLEREIQKEIRREERLKEEKKERSMQMLSTQMEARIGGILNLPLRLQVKRSLGRVKKNILGGVSSSITYLVFVSIPLFLLLFLFLLMVFMISTLSGSVTLGAYSPQGAEIVAYAETFVGKTRYVWGDGRNSATDWQDYADCSSFVHGVFSHFGYEIGWTTMQMETSGELIGRDLSIAVPGDIILFYSGGIGPGNSTHVGIYKGDGYMIDCEGDQSNYSMQTAGKGVSVAKVSWDPRPFVIRRIVKDVSGDGNATGGHKKDQRTYSKSELELIWAIVAQEDNGSYKGALAVITCAMNRTESSSWKYLGNHALSQLTAPGQFCYSIDTHWMKRLGGNVPQYVKQAVNDCLKKGIRNHSYTSFRSTKGSQTGENAVQIGGNWFFGH